MSNSCNVWGPLANESIPLKHVLGWRGGGSQGGDLTLNSLLRTWLSLKHPPSFRAFKQLGCMAKSRVSFWWISTSESRLWTLKGKEGFHLMQRTLLRRWAVEKRVIFWHAGNEIGMPSMTYFDVRSSTLYRDFRIIAKYVSGELEVTGFMPRNKCRLKQKKLCLS